MTIFTDAANALGPFVGGSAVAGALLGFAVIFIAMTGFTVMFGRDFMKSQSSFFMVLFIIGFLSIPNVTGWFPIWLPFLIVFVAALTYWLKFF